MKKCKADIRRSKKQFFKFWGLTNGKKHDIIPCVARIRDCDGGIAQLARAIGSYPIGRRFKSDFRYHEARWSSG